MKNAQSGLSSNLQPAAGPAPIEDADDALYRKIGRRIIPILMLCYVVAYLDRVNIGFAKLQMIEDLGLDNAVYAMGASIFFWGYMLFEVPSNILLHRLGARVWITRIMITWGIASGAIAFTAPLASLFGVQNSTMFYILRFLLGICEAGFFPGVVLYVNQWFPIKRQSRVFSIFLAALPVSLILGGPLSGWLLRSTHGLHSFGGWQWLLVLEAAPAVLMGLVVWFALASSAETASWLSPAEKQAVQANLARNTEHKSHRFSAALRDVRLWLLMGILLTFNTGFYGLSFWLPTIIQNSGVQDPLHIGLLSAIPYIAGGLAMFFNARHSARTGERQLHTAIPALIGGVGLILSAMFASSVPASMTFLTIAAAGILGMMPVFWTLPGTILSGAAAAAGIALINSIGSLSGVAGSFISSIAQNVTGDINNGTYVLGFSLLVAAGLAMLLPRKTFQES
ncbi:MFS transporter [Achromobacter aegrifaciens]